MESEPFSILSQVKTGAKISFDARLAFFNGAPQFGYFKNVSAKTAEGKPIEPSTVVYEELAPKTITFDDLKKLTVEGAKPNPDTLKGEQLYSITGVVSGVANRQYGNMYISEDGSKENEFYLYGLTATETAMTYDKSTGTYTYNNPQDFSKNEKTKDIKAGDTITVTFKLDEFKGSPQGNAILESVQYAPGFEAEGTLYSYTFESGVLKKDGGEATLANLTWTYDPMTFIGFDTSSGRGVQIGSGGNPQTTPWNLKTSIPEEVKVNGYEIVLNGASGTDATYTVTIGDHEKTANFDNAGATVTETSLDLTADEFKLTLVSRAKAMYITSIKIDFIIPSGVDFLK